MDSLSEAYSSAQSTFVFMKTAECISKIRATPTETSFLAPIHGLLELFMELFGLFCSPQQGQNNVYGQNSGIEVYSEKYLYFSYDIWGKKNEPGLTVTTEDFSQIS